MVKYIHLAMDDKLHTKLIEIKGDRTWIEFMEVEIARLDKEEME